MTVASLSPFVRPLTSRRTAIVQRRVLVALTLGFLSAGAACDPSSTPEEKDKQDPDNDPDVVDDGLPPPSEYQCPSSAANGTTCLDFNDGEAPGLLVEDGSFEVMSGRLVGIGPEVGPTVCNETHLSNALIDGTSARDVRVHMQLASVQRVDKAVVLRSVDTHNRVQLNFRAHDADGGFGDLMVQELRDCVFTIHTAAGELPVDHQMEEQIDVVIELVGDNLKVLVNGDVVVDRAFPFASVAGLVGVAVIDRSTAVFDDVLIENLGG